VEIEYAGGLAHKTSTVLYIGTKVTSGALCIYDDAESNRAEERWEGREWPFRSMGHRLDVDDFSTRCSQEAVIWLLGMNSSASNVQYEVLRRRKLNLPCEVEINGVLSRPARLGGERKNESTGKIASVDL
jgi:hypothetical protein